MSRGSLRREEIAAAVWRVLGAGGFSALTVRAVAAELGATTGTVMHHFPAKARLTGFALQVLEERTDATRSSAPGEGLPALRAVVASMLPLDETSTTTNRVWVASWDAALADPVLRAEHAARYERGRDRLERLAAGAGAADPAATASRLQAAVLGLVVQAVLDPGSRSSAELLAAADRAIEDALRR